VNVELVSVAGSIDREKAAVTVVERRMAVAPLAGDIVVTEGGGIDAGTENDHAKGVAMVASSVAVIDESSRAVYDPGASAAFGVNVAWNETGSYDTVPATPPEGPAKVKVFVLIVEAFNALEKVARGLTEPPTSPAPEIGSVLTTVTGTGSAVVNDQAVAEPSDIPSVARAPVEMWTV
jgi:hypothetical protein